MLASTAMFMTVFLAGSMALQPSPPSDSEKPESADPEVAHTIAPDAKIIVNRYIEATGGRDAWSSIKSIQGNGTISIPAASISGTAEYAITSDLYRNTFMMSGGAVEGAAIITGRNGDVIWQLSGEKERYNGKIIEGAERLRSLRQYQFNQLLNLEKNFLSAEIVDMEEIKGSMAIKILMVPKESPASKEYRFFDQSSNLIVKTIIESPGGPLQAAFFGAYQQAGPIKIHTETKRMAGDQVLMLISTPNIVVNKPLPASYSELPLEIRVLLGEEKIAPPAIKAE